MQVSRSTKPLTNHSWQVWRSIYNNHINVKISPIMIWVLREQAMLINAQGQLYEGTRQHMLMTKHNNVDQTFWIFYFLKDWSKTMWNHLKQMQINRTHYTNSQQGVCALQKIN